MNCPKCGKTISPDDKECRFCGVIIAKAFRPKKHLPVKKETPQKQVRGGILALVGIVVLLIAGMSLYGTFFLDEIPQTKKSPNVIEVSAEELYRAYADNELSADLKYDGKKLLVRGEFRTAFMQFGKPNVLLDVGSWLFSIQCIFDNNSQRLANLKKGDEVLIKGKCTGKTGNVFIKNCVLQ